MSRRDEPKEYVRVDSTGRLVVVGSALREALKARGGIYTYLPSESHLLHFRRTESTPAGDEFNRPIVLSGDVGGFNPMDTINFIHSSQMSGSLIFNVGSVRKWIFFKNGMVRGAGSNRSADRLKEVLYRYGALSREQIEKASEECRKIRRPLGNYLLDQGYIDQAVLYMNVRRQVEEIFYSVLLFNEGDFFLTSYDAASVPGPMALNTQSLLMEGLRRIDEMKHFCERIPEDGLFTVAKEASQKKEINSRERLVLKRIGDATLAVDEIIDRCHLGRFETIRLLYQLHEKRLIEQVEREESIDIAALRQPTEEQLEAREMIGIFNSVFTRIYQAIARHGQHGALTKGLETFLQFYGFVKLFEGVSFNEGELNASVLLTNLGNSGSEDPQEFLSQALNELLFFEMFAAREWLDREEQQELQKIINQLFIEIG